MMLLTITVSLRLACISQVLFKGRVYEEFLSNRVTRQLPSELVAITILMV